jgi:uncharacterized protein YneF (UPF0154 family)
LNNRNTGIGKTIIVGILVVVIIMAGAVGYYLTAPAPELPGVIRAVIVPTIYSSKENIGVLNEMSTFEINIWNQGNSPKNVEIVLTVEDELITNETVSIAPGSSRNETLNQRLSDVGMWKVRAIFENKTIESYSFVTMTNKDEADLKIEELQNEGARRSGEFIKLIVEIVGSIVGIIIAVAGGIWGIHKYRQKKKKHPPSKEEQIDYADIMPSERQVAEFLNALSLSWIFELPVFVYYR